MANPYELTAEEKEVIKKLKFSFVNNEKLQSHIRFLFSKGNIYLKCNRNLLYHGCIPTESNGDFSSVIIDNISYSGKKLLEAFEYFARNGYFKKEGDKEKEFGKTIMWYLWNGPHSPLYGKNKMTTFENYFIDDKELCKEEKNYYFKYRDNEDFIARILKEFDLEPHNSHIINGHVPVESIKGEKPVKAGGKLLVIDGGFSRPYRETTGIAGYTLIFNSKGLILTAHEPFHSKNKAIKEESDIISYEAIVEKTDKELLINDTDTGKEIKEQIFNLKNLVEAYQNGILKEKG